MSDERRKRSLTDEDIAAIMASLQLNRPLSMATEEHRLHHEFLSHWMKREEARMARYEKIKANVFGWLIITVLGGIGTGVYHAYQYLKEHLR